MNLLTRAKLTFGTVVLLVAAAVAYQMFGGGTDISGRDKGEEHVLLLATFAGTRPVIIYQVGSTPAAGYDPQEAPWSQWVWANKGERILLSATLKGGEIVLWIVHRDVTIPCDPRELYGPGTISCQYVVA